ncbi:unnamed protein product [Candida verbasci]|uniref:Uncharacterized protein n=1 Tax=Candida verbasci TaxID=1227364 RepID=A0A9W4TUR8_9ASCO|nr:unnamed protein product [Candida verbasci]
MSDIVTPHSRPLTPNPQSSASSNHSSTKLQVPPFEKSIYESLNHLYKNLLELKNNRDIYINSKQTYTIYDQFLNIIYDLKLVRKDEELKGLTLVIPNNNDLIIDDIFQLISLCFVTCGLIKFAPATYSSLSTVMKLLNHLKECKVYTMEDLQPIGSRLEEIRDIILNSNENYELDDHDQFSKGLQDNHQIEETLLRNKLNKCEHLYDELVDNFNNFPKDLEPIYHKLINIRKNILNYITNLKQDTSGKVENVTNKIESFKTELKKIEKLRDEHDGKFHSDLDDNRLESSQAIINGLIDDCNNLLNDLLIHEEEISLENLKISDSKDEVKLKFDSLYQQLLDLKLTLENLLITRRWTLRETDLYNYQKLLKTIDDERIQLMKSATTKSQDYKKSQTLILYLLRRCYSIIYKLLESSEPVSESLTPIHNQLQTVKRCLLELKRVDGLNNLRELYPFQFKLGSIDNLRKDGKFIIDNHVPEGQGALCALLSECFDILQEMKIELEEKELENGDDLINDDINGGSFTNSKHLNDADGDINLTDDEVEIKRNRFKEFKPADYDIETESVFDDDDDDDDDDYKMSENEYEENDYY